MGDYREIRITRDQVFKPSMEPVLVELKDLIRHPFTAKAHFEKISLHFDGFACAKSELWTVPEFRDFIVQLSSKFPYWLFFLTKETDSLQIIVKCFLLPHIAQKEERKINGPLLEQHLTQLAFPALNQLLQWCDFNEETNISMSEEVIKYFEKHPPFS